MSLILVTVLTDTSLFDLILGICYDIGHPIFMIYLRVFSILFPKYGLFYETPLYYHLIDMLTVFHLQNK